MLRILRISSRNCLASSPSIFNLFLTLPKNRHSLRFRNLNYTGRQNSRTIPIPISFNCNFIRGRRFDAFAPATVQFFVLLRLPQREMHRRQFRPSPANLFSPRDKLVSRGPIRLFDCFLRFRPEGGRGGEGATPGVSQGVLRALLSNRRLSSVSPLINIYAVLPNTWSHSRDHRRSGSFSVPPWCSITRPSLRPPRTRREGDTGRDVIIRDSAPPQ